MIRSSVERLTAYTPGEQPQGGGFIKLNTNENPYPPSPAVAQALAGFDPARLRLYPDPLNLPVREAAARLHGCGVERVFAGNGSDEILALCARAFVEHGGTVGYFVPSYSLYPVLADIVEARHRPVELGPEFGWAMPDGYAADLFLLACPNAPTGLRYAKATVRDFCRSFRGVVVIDEAYVDFADEHCMDLALELDNVLVMRTLSKSYSLAGLRVGYVVGPTSLVGALFKIKDSYNLDALSQRIAAAALSDPGSMRANVQRIRATRGRLTSVLRAMGHEVYDSQTNFLWVRPSGIAARELYRKLKDRRVLIRHFAGGRTGDCVRITVGTDVEVDGLLAVLEEMKP